MKRRRLPLSPSQLGKSAERDVREEKSPPSLGLGAPELTERRDSRAIRTHTHTPSPCRPQTSAPFAHEPCASISLLQQARKGPDLESEGLDGGPTTTRSHGRRRIDGFGRDEREKENMHRFRTATPDPTQDSRLHMQPGGTFDAHPLPANRTRRRIRAFQWQSALIRRPVVREGNPAARPSGWDSLAHAVSPRHRGV
jgi:hypothetical protein